MGAGWDGGAGGAEHNDLEGVTIGGSAGFDLKSLRRHILDRFADHAMRHITQVEIELKPADEDVCLIDDGDMQPGFLPWRHEHSVQRHRHSRILRRHTRPPEHHHSRTVPRIVRDKQRIKNHTGLHGGKPHSDGGIGAGSYRSVQSGWERKTAVAVCESDIGDFEISITDVTERDRCICEAA